MEVFLLIILGTSLWMAFDAHQIGYDKKDVKGMAGMGPLGWLFGGLLLWIIAFPLYLVSRSKLKEAAAQKNGHGTPTGEPPVGADTTDESEKKSLPGRMGRAFVNAVYVLGALAVAIPLLVWISSDSDDKTVSGQPASATATIAEAAAAPERPAPVVSATERSRASRLAGIRSDNSQLSRAVLNFCTHSPDADQCVLDQWSSATKLALATAQYQPGSTEHRIFSACFNKFAPNGTGDYVQIEACASQNPQVRDLIAYLGTLQ